LRLRKGLYFTTNFLTSPLQCRLHALLLCSSHIVKADNMQCT